MAGEGFPFSDPQSGAQLLAAINGLGSSGFAVADDVFAIKGSADATKLARFEVDGITTGTTRTFTLPNADVIVAGSAAALTSGRVPHATTGGLLTDGAGLTYSSNSLGVGDGTAAASIIINGLAGTDRQWIFRTAGSSRWQLICSSGAESGSNAGSDLTFVARADDGSSLGSVLTLTRAASGAVAMLRPVTMSSTLAVTGVTTIGGTSQAIVTSTSAVTPNLQVNGTTAAGSYISATRWANSAGTVPSLVLAKSRGAAVGTHAVVSSGDALGLIAFNGSDGTDFTEAARISCEVDGTPGNDDMPGRILFHTTADGAATGTERLRIASDGVITVATGATLVAAKTTGTTVTVSSTGKNSVLLAGGMVLGDTTNRTYADIDGGLQVSTASGATAALTVFRHSAGAGQVRIVMGASRGAAGTATAVQSSDGLGTLMFVGADGTDYATVAGQLLFEVGGAVSTGVVPGLFRLRTRNTGGTLADRLTITAAGDVAIKTGALTVDAGNLTLTSGHLITSDATKAILVGTSSNFGTAIYVERQKTLSGAVGSDISCIGVRPSYTGAFTVARASYFALRDPALSGSAVVTDACALYFDAAAGTHKALDGATTKTTPGTVNAWVKLDVNGTLYYVPAYTSKTT